MTEISEGNNSRGNNSRDSNSKENNNKVINNKEITPGRIWKLWSKIQKERPLVHCITNIVTVNDCANILLAAGASPTMAHHPLEAAEVTEGCRSLVCNLGATEAFEAMTAAGKRASELSHPLVIDPVGVSGSSYRRELCFTLIRHTSPSCIRGNFSEIRALAFNQKTTAGVDALRSDTMNDRIREAADVVRTLAIRYKTIVIASGETDLLSDGSRTYAIHNGSPLMAKITGSGCMSSALLGAFLSVENTLESAVASCAVMGICGEIAQAKTEALNGGTGTFRTQLIDTVSLLEEAQIKVRYSLQ